MRELRQKAAFMFMLALLLTGVLAFAAGCAESVFNRDASGFTQRASIPNHYFTDGLAPLAEWNKTYGGSGWDVANSFIQTSDGGYLLAGWAQSYGAGMGDFWLVKTNSAGRMLWNRTYGGAYYDEAFSLMLTGDGGYAIAGDTRSYGAGETDFWLVKTDSNGIHQWNRTYGGTGSEMLYSATRTSDGGFALAGYTDSYGEGGDSWLVKTDSDGTMQWSKFYGEEGRDQTHAVIQTEDGGYALVGETDSIGAGATDVWLVKVSSDEGGEQWSYPYGGVGCDGGYALLQTADGDYIIAGYTESFGLGMPYYPDIWLVKIDSKGEEVWDPKKTYGGLGADYAESLVSINNGGFAVAGATTSYGVGGQDFWLVTTDSAGNRNYDQTYGGISNDYAYSLIGTSDGGFALAGNTFSYGAGSADMWLVKVEGDIPRHDIAIIDVFPSKSAVGQGYSLLINVTVENQGNRLETINVTAYADANIIATLANLLTITPGNTRTVVFTWDTADGEFPKGAYTIRAETTIAPPNVDADPADNSLANGPVHIVSPGDVDASGRVDVFDMLEFGKAYFSHSGDPSWNANCDINGDGEVNASDLCLISEGYGKNS